jgi:hypothetical protein
MRFVAIDSETENFSPGDQVPRLVCVSVCVQGKEPQLYGHVEGAAVDRGVVLVSVEEKAKVGLANRHGAHLLDALQGCFHVVEGVANPADEVVHSILAF